MKYYSEKTGRIYETEEELRNEITDAADADDGVAAYGGHSAL